jgi:hypothetical protein
MNLILHAFVSAVLTVMFYPFIGIWAFLAFLGGFFVDFDHYLWFVYKKNSLSLRRAYKWYKKKEFGKGIWNIFHTLEFMILLLLLTIIFPLLLPFTVSYYAHMALDFVHLSYSKNLDSRIISIIWQYIKKKN